MHMFKCSVSRKNSYFKAIYGPGGCLPLPGYPTGHPPFRLVEMVIEAGGTTHILECILVDHIFQPSLSVLTFISLYIMIVSQKLERRKIKKLLTESKKHDLRL